MQELTIRFARDPVPGGRWVAQADPEPAPASDVVDWRTPWSLRVEWIDDDGLAGRGRPPGIELVGGLLERAEELIAEHYEPVDFREDDPTVGWTDEDARREFVRTMDRVGRDLRRAVSAQPFGVRVSVEPGANEVLMMGEYSCDWPLWHHGAGDAEDWPMLSAALVERLSAWAAIAEPDSGREPDPAETRRLALDVQSELGDRYRVRLLD